MLIFEMKTNSGKSGAGLGGKKTKTKTTAEAEEWLVEKIVNKRFRMGRVDYFVKWKDFPSSANTWEPIEHLSSCPEFIEEYEGKQLKQGNNKRKSSSLNVTAKSVRQSSQTVADKADTDTKSSTSVSVAHVNAVRILEVDMGDDTEEEFFEVDSEDVVEESEIDWEGVGGITGVYRTKKSPLLFYKLMWKRTDGSIQFCSVPAAVARNRVPDLVIKYLSGIIKWVPKNTSTSTD